VRVYLPATLPLLRSLVSTGAISSPVAFAVTPALREWYVEGDIDELEYAVLGVAARASLRLLAAAPHEAARRVVIAADVPDALARPAPDVDRAAVRLGEPVATAQVVSAHVDDTSAEVDVRAAASASAAADAGDEDAAFLLDGVEDHELGWYAAQEIDALVELES
jgi:hypothetical protein